MDIAYNIAGDRARILECVERLRKIKRLVRYVREIISFLPEERERERGGIKTDQRRSAIARAYEERRYPRGKIHSFVFVHRHYHRDNRGSRYANVASYIFPRRI